LARLPGLWIPVDDRGLALGDGLFETVLALDGAMVALDAHLDRLNSGCAILDLPAPDLSAARSLMDEAIAADPAPRLAVRLTVTAGSGGRGLDRPDSPALRLFATAAPAPEPAGPARLVTCTVRRNEGSPASRLKTLSYLDNILARREAQAAGADEALMLNGAGEAACASAANIFWIKDGRLFTPTLDCGVLAGVMRARVIGLAASLGVQAVEVRAAPQAVIDADGVFLTSSLIGVRPVAGLDGVSLAQDPLVDALRRAVRGAGLA
jgi:branched-subunit amino acid aminotransferase/4-amino-4-deoxychorismate lyase